MSAIARTYTFTDGTDAYGSQVENEFNTIYNAWNNHDAGTSIWTSLKAALLTMSGNIVMATNKITGLGNGTAAQDAAAFSQLKVIQTVTGTSTTDFSTTNVAFQSTNLTASITPTSASNRVLVIVTGSLSQATQNNTSYLSISRAGSNIGGANGFTAMFSVTGANTCTGVAIVTVDSPASTSSTGYTVTLRVGGGTGHFGVNSETQTIVLMEIV